MVYETMQDARVAMLNDVKEHRENIKKACELYGKQLCEIAEANFYDLCRNIEIHDISKINNEEEFKGFLAKFYPSKDNPLLPHQIKIAYDRARLSHYHNNKDHPEFWVYIKDNQLIANEMDKEYVCEMILNWIAISMENNNISVEDYWVLNRDAHFFHENTLKLIDLLIEQYRLFITQNVNE